jgi:hypothetical protein
VVALLAKGVQRGFNQHAFPFFAIQMLAHKGEA